MPLHSLQLPSVHVLQMPGARVIAVTAKHKLLGLLSTGLADDAVYLSAERSASEVCVVLCVWLCGCGCMAEWLWLWLLYVCIRLVSPRFTLECSVQETAAVLARSGLMDSIADLLADEDAATAGAITEGAIPQWGSEAPDIYHPMCSIFALDAGRRLMQKELELQARTGRPQNRVA